MSTHQFGLWHNPSLDVTLRVKAALREVLSECPKSREAIAELMSAAARKEGLAEEGRTPVSPDMLDKWVSSSATAHRMPYHYLTIFCFVTDSLLPIQAMLAPLCARAVTGEDMDLLELARIKAQKDELARQERAIKQRRKK
ncbi:hypothetical protein [Fundidesulfovibrio putealis]|uniref:hypothetical protein n=1 Tax=Fundidesulfovibrio putealis TaxID=270496 RepID=UPI0003F9372C|nr:hypothetical protein [Fundidesulfovibrio putealis]